MCVAGTDYSIWSALNCRWFLVSLGFGNCTTRRLAVRSSSCAFLQARGMFSLHQRVQRLRNATIDPAVRSSSSRPSIFVGTSAGREGDLRFLGEPRRKQETRELLHLRRSWPLLATGMQAACRGCQEGTSSGKMGPLGRPRECSQVVAWCPSFPGCSSSEAVY